MYFMCVFLVLSFVSCLNDGNLRIKMAYRYSIFLHPRNFVCGALENFELADGIYVWLPASV